MAKLIQLVGVSGAGKSSVQRKIKEWLETEMYHVEEIIEPGPLRNFAKKYRLKPEKNPWAEAAIFTADRIITYEEKILPRYEETSLIFLSARGFFDTIVYQGLIGGVNIGYIKKMNSSIPLPDIAFALTVNGKIGSERISARNKETKEAISENETAQKIDLLSSKYKELPHYFPEANIHLLDTSLITLEEVVDHIQQKVREVLNA